MGLQPELNHHSQAPTTRLSAALATGLWPVASGQRPLAQDPRLKVSGQSDQRPEALASFFHLVPSPYSLCFCDENALHQEIGPHKNAPMALNTKVHGTC